jgi:hypothetical protein
VRHVFRRAKSPLSAWTGFCVSYCVSPHQQAIEIFGISMSYINNSAAF